MRVRVKQLTPPAFGWLWFHAHTSCPQRTTPPGGAAFFSSCVLPRSAARRVVVTSSPRHVFPRKKRGWQSTEKSGIVVPLFWLFFCSYGFFCYLINRRRVIIGLFVSHTINHTTRCTIEGCTTFFF